MEHAKQIMLITAIIITFSSQIMSHAMKINKVVIPAAGLGTRFLPYTKAIPKEMLPILEKPSIQLIIEEGIASEITAFGIIANNDKQAIMDHLSHQYDLEEKLSKTGKLGFLDSINAVIDRASFTVIPQAQPLGLGHAILMAKDFVGDEYFGVSLPDEIMIGELPALAQVIAIAHKYNASVIGVLEVPREKVSSYGIVAIEQKLEDGVFEISHLVEKPSIDSAPSNFAVAGRYILSPRIFASLEVIKPGAGGEFQLTDGIADMMRKGERVLAYVMKTSRYDVGNPLGWLKANIEIALNDPRYSIEIKNFLEKKMQQQE